MRYIVAGQMCAEARLAVTRHAIDEAEQCLHRAIGVDPAHPEITDIRVRLAVARGRLDQASTALDRAEPGNVSRRLLRQLLRLYAGDAAGAHLALNEWTRHDDCPPGARTVAAWLHWRAGRPDAARRCLAPILRDPSNSRALRLAALIEQEAGQPAALSTQLSRLRSRFSHRPRSSAFLRAIDAEQTRESGLSLDQIDQLAGELCARPDVIPTLVAAQRWKADAERIELLRRAIARIADTLVEPFDAIEGLAELSLQAGDLDEAQRWARRGLAIKPMSAKLALVLDQVDQAITATVNASVPETTTVGAFGVLRRVAEAHPDYSDVLGALVQRYRRSGMDVLADRLLEKWLVRKPEDRIANGLASEAAA